MTRTRAWLLAARPATLWAAVVPVLVGGGLAWGESSGAATSGGWFKIGSNVVEGAFRADAFVVTLLAALAIQV
ncbi:MAG: hypothetical protein V3S60_02380, partial [Acidimicrobiia bacterium]